MICADRISGSAPVQFHRRSETVPRTNVASSSPGGLLSTVQMSTVENSANEPVSAPAESSSDCVANAGKQRARARAREREREPMYVSPRVESWIAFSRPSSQWPNCELWDLSSSAADLGRRKGRAGPSRHGSKVVSGWTTFARHSLKGTSVRLP